MKNFWNSKHFFWIMFETEPSECRKTEKEQAKIDAGALKCLATMLTTRHYSPNKLGLGVLEVKGICQWECGWLV